MIYLDHHATTPLDPRVRDAMRPYWQRAFGNPHSRHHRLGREAHRAVEQARADVAALIGADASEIIFTSGASEANNLALLGLDGAGQTVISAIEHPSVAAPAAASNRSVQTLPVDSGGFLDLDTLATALKMQTRLVSVQAANHEIGSLQDLPTIIALAHAAGALVHVDAAQAAGKIPLNTRQLQPDLMSISAHKFHGPSGIGALFVARHVQLAPLLHGGGQEFGLRSGTVPMPLAVGFGEAARIAKAEQHEEAERLERLRDRLWHKLDAAMDGLVVNGSMARRLPGNLNISVPRSQDRGWVDAARWLEAMPELALSTGAACAEASQRPSTTLRAIGLSPHQIAGSLRIGLGRFTHQQEIDRAAEIMNRIHQRFTT